MTAPVYVSQLHAVATVVYSTQAPVYLSQLRAVATVLYSTQVIRQATRSPD